jgi:hypothetical protein
MFNKMNICTIEPISALNFSVKQNESENISGALAAI